MQPGVAPQFLFFMTLMPLKTLSSYFIDFFFCFFLMFSPDLIQVIYLWQEYHKSDVPFSVHHIKR